MRGYLIQLIQAKSRLYEKGIDILYRAGYRRRSGRLELIFLVGMLFSSAIPNMADPPWIVSLKPNPI